MKEIFNYKLVEFEEVDVTIAEVFKVLIIFIIAYYLLWIIKKVIQRQIKSRKLDKGRTYSFFQIVKYLVWIIAISLALAGIGFKLDYLVAGAAALLVGLGFGIQQIFNDFISGLIILFEGTIQVGDVIETDEIIGRVLQINLRTTKMISRDDIILIIPNSKFVNYPVTNWSHIQTKSRFNVDVGVAYGSDVDVVKKLLIECAHEHPSLSQDPPPVVQFTDFADSSLNFRLWFYSENIFRIENIKSDLRFSVNDKFIEYGIKIPFPQRDMHIISNTKN
ncbi:MAG: mechanosensitive ion channel [Bacteroidia bacterium]|nr:mechanosensitive ion channel [Bacteroidia bacterium]